MWNLFNCYLSGRHDFSTWCEPGSVFLRCLHCGKRSSGWALEQKPQRLTAPVLTALPSVHVAPAASARLLPFNRAAAR
jgi:hypothetical protein